MNDALVALRKSATSLSAEMTPAQWDFLGDLDAQPLFGGDLVQDIENKFATNGIMPAVVKAFVGELLTKRQKILENYRNILSNVEAIGLRIERLNAGEAEVGFTIPRSLFENSLAGLAGEFKFIDKVMIVFSEVVTGEREPAMVGELSTTDPLILVTAGVAVVAAVGKTVTWLLDRYEQTLRIRKLMAESAAIGAPDSIQNEYKSLILKTINDGIDARISELLPNPSQPREQELSNGLRLVMQGMLARIERGMKVEIRFLPPVDEKAETKVDADAAQKKKNAYLELTSIQQKLNFPLELPSEPVLALPPPEPGEQDKLRNKSRSPKSAKGPTGEQSTAVEGPAVTTH